MIDNIFDKKVKDILSNLKMDYKSDSWKRLENKLDNIEQEDAAFDSIIAGKLRKHSVIASKNAYKRFENSTESPKNNKYLYYIVGVAAALILLLYAVFNIDFGQIETLNSSFLANNERISDKFNKENKVVVDVSKLIPSNHNLSNRKESLGELEKVSKLKEVDFGDIEVNEVNPIPITNVVDFECLENEKLNGKNFNFGVMFNSNNNQIKNSYFINPYLRSITLLNSGYINDFKRNNLVANKSTTSSQLFNSNFPIINRTTILNKNEIASIDKSNDYIDELKRGKSQLNGVDKSISSNQMDPFIINSHISNGLFISAHVSPDINLVDTPNDLVLNIPGYSHSTFGVSAGLSVSLKNGKNEFETGLEYNAVKYSPRKTPSKIDESKSYYLKNIKYDIVKLPMNYKFHVVENKNWDIYSIAGVSANIIANSDYRFVEQTNIGGIDFKLEKYANELKYDNNFQQSLYSQKNYNVGAFEGGNINKNIYLAVNAGVGIKRKLKKGLSLFFEPQFNYNVNTFGPNVDNINNLNLNFGINKVIAL